MAQAGNGAEYALCVERILASAASRMAALATLPTDEDSLQQVASEAKARGATDLQHAVLAMSAAESQVHLKHTPDSASADVHRRVADMVAPLLAQLELPPPSGGEGSPTTLALVSSLLASLAPLARQRLSKTSAQASDLAIETRNRQARLEETERELEQLTEELRKQRDARSKRKADASAKVKVLKAEIESARRTCEEEMAGIASSSAVRLRHTTDAGARATTGLTLEIERLSSKHQAQIQHNTEAEAAQRRHTNRTRADLSEATSETEAATSEHTRTVAVLQAEVDEMTGPLLELRQYYKRVDSEIVARAAEDAEVKLKHFLEVTLVAFKKRVMAKKIQRWYAAVKRAKAEAAKLAKKQAAKAAAGTAGGKKKK